MLYLDLLFCQNRVKESHCEWKSGFQYSVKRGLGPHPRAGGITYHLGVVAMYHT